VSGKGEWHKSGDRSFGKGGTWIKTKDRAIRGCKEKRDEHKELNLCSRKPNGNKNLESKGTKNWLHRISRSEHSPLIGRTELPHVVATLPNHPTKKPKKKTHEKKQNKTFHPPPNTHQHTQKLNPANHCHKKKNKKQKKKKNPRPKTILGEAYLRWGTHVAEKKKPVSG